MVEQGARLHATTSARLLHPAPHRARLLLFARSDQRRVSGETAQISYASAPSPSRGSTSIGATSTTRRTPRRLLRLPQAITCRRQPHVHDRRRVPLPLQQRDQQPAFRDRQRLRPAAHPRLRRPVVRDSVRLSSKYIDARSSRPEPAAGRDRRDTADISTFRGPHAVDLTTAGLAARRPAGVAVRLAAPDLARSTG